MKEQIRNKERQVSYMQEHTLSEQDLRKLIKEKIARAQAYKDAWKKREALLEKSR